MYLHGLYGLGNVDPVAYVTGLYRELLGREPEPAGLQSWVAAMQNGMTPEQVRQGFMQSPEYVNRMNSLQSALMSIQATQREQIVYLLQRVGLNPASFDVGSEQGQSAAIAALFSAFRAKGIPIVSSGRMLPAGASVDEVQSDQIQALYNSLAAVPAPVAVPSPTPTTTPAPAPSSPAPSSGGGSMPVTAPVQSVYYDMPSAVPPYGPPADMPGPGTGSTPSPVPMPAPAPSAGGFNPLLLAGAGLILFAFMGSKKRRKH